MASQVMRITLKAYDHQLVDQSAGKIIETVKKTGSQVSGPVPLPTKKEVVTILLSLIHISYALVGELMCTRMKILGAAGAVVNGFHRDTNGILDLDFPCFSYGRYAQDKGCLLYTSRCV